MNDAIAEEFRIQELSAHENKSGSCSIKVEQVVEALPVSNETL